MIRTGEKTWRCPDPHDCHPFRRRAARARQDHQIDPGERQISAQRDDDRLHAHVDDDQPHQNLVGHARRDRVEDERGRRLQAAGADLDERDVDEADEGANRQIDRAAAGEGRRHQRVGRQNQRHGDDDRAADAAGGDQPGLRSTATSRSRKNSRIGTSRYMLPVEERRWDGTGSATGEATALISAVAPRGPWRNSGVTGPRRCSSSKASGSPAVLPASDGGDAWGPVIAWPPCRVERRGLAARRRSGATGGNSAPGGPPRRPGHRGAGVTPSAPKAPAIDASWLTEHRFKDGRRVKLGASAKSRKWRRP